MAAGMDHVVDGPARHRDGPAESGEDLGRVTITADVEPGPAAAGGQVPGLRLVEPALDARRCATRSRRRWPRRATPAGTGCSPPSAPTWTTSGSAPTSSSRATPSCSRRCASRSSTRCRRARGASGARSPAKGLTGPGYDGHAFWDTETFVLPVLTYTAPRRRPRRAALAPRDARPRARARQAARTRRRGLSRGARSPARSARATGRREPPPSTSTPTSPTRSAATRPRPRTQAFEREVGLELLVETARLWRSLGHHDAEGRFRIDGVTGPDEYSAIADNNVYTNLMAQRNLRLAADAVERHPDRAARARRRLGGDGRLARRRRRDAHPLRRSARRPPAGRGLHRASSAGTSTHTAPEQYPLLLHFPYFDLYRKQVVKQADLVLALHLRGDAFSDEEKARNFAYYEALTVRDSSLSACTQAVIAAEVGHLELAYDYFGEAALIDLDDLEHNTRDGLHIASLAGAWIVAVAGFGGMRDHDGSLSFAPRLPERLSRLAFGLCFRGRRLRVEVDHRAGALLAARRGAARDRPPRRDGHDQRRRAGDAADPAAAAARVATAATRQGTGATAPVGMSPREASAIKLQGLLEAPGGPSRHENQPAQTEMSRRVRER